MAILSIVSYRYQCIKWPLTAVQRTVTMANLAHVQGHGNGHWHGHGHEHSTHPCPWPCHVHVHVHVDDHVLVHVHVHNKDCVGIHSCFFCRNRVLVQVCSWTLFLCVHVPCLFWRRTFRNWIWTMKMTRIRIYTRARAWTWTALTDITHLDFNNKDFYGSSV